MRTLQPKTAALSALGLILSLALGVASLAARSRGPAPPDTRPPSEATTPLQGASPTLSPGAQEVARLIGVAGLVARYGALPQNERAYGSGMSREAMMLRMEITESTLSASLDADGVLAELDSELATLGDIQTTLENRRDRALSIGTIASLVAGGIGGVIATAMQLSDRTSKPGNIIGVSGGAVSSALAFVGLRQQRGGALEFTNAPNMLGPFFERAGEFHARYPEALWQYLNDPVPTEPERGTRRDRLTANWLAQGRVEPTDSPKGRDKISFLTAASSEKRKLTLGLVGDRTAMLQDIRTWVELMKRDLSKLMLALRAR